MSIILPNEYRDNAELYLRQPQEYPPNREIQVWAEEQLLIQNPEILTSEDFVNLRTDLIYIAEQGNCTPKQEQAKIEIARQLGNILKESCNPVLAIEITKSIYEIEDKLAIEESATNMTLMQSIDVYLIYIGNNIGRARKKSLNLKKQTRATLLARSPNAEILNEIKNTAYQTAIDILRQRQRTIEEL